MFSFGWPELLLIAILALFFVGPNDIPKVMYEMGRFFQRLGHIKYIFTKRFDNFMEEAELAEHQKRAEQAPDIDPKIEAESDEDAHRAEKGDA